LKCEGLRVFVGGNVESHGSFGRIGIKFGDGQVAENVFGLAGKNSIISNCNFYRIGRVLFIEENIGDGRLANILVGVIIPFKSCIGSVWFHHHPIGGFINGRTVTDAAKTKRIGTAGQRIDLNLFNLHFERIVTLVGQGEGRYDLAQ